MLMISLLIFFFSFCFDWENILNTQDCASLGIQKPQISWTLGCTSYFQLSSWYLDVLMKHCLSYAKKSILHRAHARPDLPNTYWDIMVKISFYDKCRNSHSHWLIFINNKRTNTWIYWSNGLTSQNGQFDNLSLQKTNWCQFFIHLSCDWQWISS